MPVSDPPAGPPAPVPPPRPRRRFALDAPDARRRGSWFFATSVVAHVLGMAAFWLFGPKPPPPVPPPEPYGVATALLPPDPWASGGPEETTDPDAPPAEAAAPEPTHPDEALPADPTPPSAAEPEPAPEPMPTPDVPLPEPTIPDPGVIGLRRKSAPSPPSPPLPEPVVEPARANAPPVPTVDEEYADATNRRAAARVKEALRDATGALGKALRGVRSEDLLVVSNGRAFDHLEHVLEQVAIPWVRISTAELATRADLSRTRVLLWNCGPPIADASQRAVLARKVRDFVTAGGWLWSTDWGVRDVVAPAFPGRIATSEDRLRTLPELVVDVHPAPEAAADPLLEGVLPVGTPCRWWLEAAAAEVKVVDRAGVRVLLEAPILGGALYRRSPVLAVTFPAGRGRVLHVMGHAWQEKTDLEGTVSMQRLALNFLKARMEQDAAR